MTNEQMRIKAALERVPDHDMRYVAGPLLPIGNLLFGAPASASAALDVAEAIGLIADLPVDNIYTQLGGE